MDVERAEKRLKERYPGKNIIRIPEDNPTEIVCEVEPTTDHDTYSVAVAIIESSKPHVHNKSLETYKVIDGQLQLRVGGETHIMNPGESYTVWPGKVHSARGNDAMVEVESYPGWTQEDHLWVEGKSPTGS
jgi:mannose-6-phosphate isomerase-like protein (cupin superfamily)